MVEKVKVTGQLVIGYKTYTLGFVAAADDEPPLTDVRFRKMWNALGFSLAAQLRKEGKIVNPEEYAKWA